MTSARLLESGGSQTIPAASASSEAREATLARVFWITLALAAAAAVPAILGARDLSYDGAYYLLGIAAHRSFQLFEPARIAVQVLQQVFAVAGVRSGIHTLWALAVLFSLGASGWPLVLTALCWFVLPRGGKSWIAGPLLNLVLAIPATNFIAIGEGIIASCLLWLAFLLVTFRIGKPVGALASLVAVLACTIAHEAAALCLIAIAVAAAMRLSGARGFSRVVALAVVAVAAAGAFAMARRIVFPRSMVERGDYLASLLGGFAGSIGAPNIPALMAIAGAAAILAILVRRSGRVGAAVAIAGGVIVCLLALLFVEPDRALAPSRFFAARGLPVALTTMMTVLYLFLLRSGRTPAPISSAPVLAVLLGLAVCQAMAQSVMTAEWNSYVHALRHLVSTRSGVVSDAAAMKAIDPQGTRFRRELLESWSVEPLSIVLAPHGRVGAVVEAGPAARWTPYDFRNARSFPLSPSLDWSHFPSSGFH